MKYPATDARSDQSRLEAPADAPSGSGALVDCALTAAPAASQTAIHTGRTPRTFRTGMWRAVYVVWRMGAASSRPQRSGERAVEGLHSSHAAHGTSRRDVGFP